jgi:glycerophosphoryl diester phosphodiesterase
MDNLLRPALLLSSALGLFAPAAAALSTLTGELPIVIGHRGAPGHRPEHTLASYALAIDQGADYIEPDLVSTKDGHLVARHENELSGTTDVASHAEFAARRVARLIDGIPFFGWFTEDFTLAELKTLRAVERIPGIRPGNTVYDGQFEVPTFDEILDLVAAKELETGRRIGVYAETKHPTYFDNLGLSLEEPLLAALAARGRSGADSLVFIQSFETANLKELALSTELPLVQLLGTFQPYDFVVAGDPRTYADLRTPEGLAEVATYADGIGPEKAMLVVRAAGGAITGPSDLIADGHEAGLLVHAYTFRAEPIFHPLDSPNDPAAEIGTYLELGIDGFFTDNPDVGVAAVAAVPEPGTVTLVLFGLAGAAAIRRARLRRS